MPVQSLSRNSYSHTERTVATSSTHHLQNCVVFVTEQLLSDTEEIRSQQAVHIIYRIVQSSSQNSCCQTQRRSDHNKLLAGSSQHSTASVSHRVDQVVTVHKQSPARYGKSQTESSSKNDCCQSNRGSGHNKQFAGNPQHNMATIRHRDQVVTNSFQVVSSKTRLQTQRSNHNKQFTSSLHQDMATIRHRDQTEIKS